MIEILLGNLVWVLLMMLTLWVVSVRLKDVSIVDIFWGLGFVLVAWRTCLLSDGFAPRKFLIVALTTVWGLRLSFYLLKRKLGKPEDPRYAAMREKRGEDFRWMSLFTVFLLQGVILWVISLTVQVGQLSAAPDRMTALDRIGFLLWVVGFVFEAVGDAQMARFKADPANRGKVMRTGLWALTRHPNYFGESLMWWGIYAVALSVPGSAWTVISPVLITFLLLKVSGVTMLEKAMMEKGPEYRDYMETTSAFFPWFPHRRPR
jgi:steroid 5-alpha reductase family enzyme